MLIFLNSCLGWNGERRNTKLYKDYLEKEIGGKGKASTSLIPSPSVKQSWEQAQKA